MNTTRDIMIRDINYIKYLKANAKDKENITSMCRNDSLMGDIMERYIQLFKEYRIIRKIY